MEFRKRPSMRGKTPRTPDGRPSQDSRGAARRAKVTQIGGPPSEFFVACWREGGIFLVIRLQYFDEHVSVSVSRLRNVDVLNDKFAPRGNTVHHSFESRCLSTHCVEERAPVGCNCKRRRRHEIDHRARQKSSEKIRKTGAGLRNERREI